MFKKYIILALLVLIGLKGSTQTNSFPTPYGYAQIRDDANSPIAFIQSTIDCTYFGNIGNNPIAFGNASGYKKMIIQDNGNVGLGNPNPGSRLSFPNVDGTTEAEGITWYSPTRTVYGIHRTEGAWTSPNYQQLRLGWETGIILDPGQGYGKSYVDVQGAGLRVTSGDIGIGTVDTKGYKLAVNGNIRAKEVKVETANWPDYVFTKDYQLPTLQQTENHIKEKGHLPGIPSAAEVKANGIDLGEMNAKLLQKIEELTLHLIEMKKEITELRSNRNKL
ncbi:hypothetical protein [Pedobacter heparinus]|nr:hypothetical protein [Pedobacter heparinus]